MSVQTEKMPPARTVLGVLDAQAKATVQRARAEIAPMVTAAVPHGHTGATAAALRPKVRKTSSGAMLSISAPRGKRHPSGPTINQVITWINRGTGIYRSGGGPIRPIRGGALRLPGGAFVESVPGIRPDPFMRRIRQMADGRVQREFKAGAERAARAVERQVG